MSAWLAVALFYAGGISVTFVLAFLCLQECTKDLKAAKATGAKADLELEQARELITVWEYRHEATKAMLKAHGLFFTDTFDLEDAHCVEDVTRRWSE